MPSPRRVRYATRPLVASSIPEIRRPTQPRCTRSWISTTVPEASRCSGAPEHRDASGTVVLIQLRVHLGWVGRRISGMEEATSGRVAYLTRLGEGIVPGPDTVYQEGDLVHIVVRESDLPTA